MTAIHVRLVSIGNVEQFSCRQEAKCVDARHGRIKVRIKSSLHTFLQVQLGIFLIEVYQAGIRFHSRQGLQWNAQPFLREIGQDLRSSQRQAVLRCFQVDPGKAQCRIFISIRRRWQRFGLSRNSIDAAQEKQRDQHNKKNFGFFHRHFLQ